MKTYTFFLLLTLGLSFSACTVTHNIYVSDPVSLPKGESEIHVGLGTGHYAKTDNVDEDGNVTFNDKLEMAPNFFFAGRYGLSDQLDLRYALHLPYIVGGFGLRAGVLYSFLPRESKFNMGVGSDVGFIFARDSIRFLGDGIELNAATTGAIHGDLFLSFAYQFNENYRLILSPRYSFNGIWMKTNIYEDKTELFKPNLSSLALGLRMNKIYLETSVTYLNDNLIPNFGIVYFPGRKQRKIEGFDPGDLPDDF